MCGAEGVKGGPLFAYPCLTASFSLSLSFLQEKSAGFQEKEFQVFKECFTSLRHLEIERKGLSHRVSPELFC